MESALLAVAVFLVSLTVCAAFVPPTRVLARRFGVVDQPGGRRVHSEPTPRLGGAAIVASFLAVVLGGYWVSLILGESGLARSAFGQAAGDAAGGLARGDQALRPRGRLARGVPGRDLDDVFGARFPVLAKLFGQVLAAAIVVAAGVRPRSCPWSG